MNCAYHGQNAAVVNCNGCGKPLCPACDHRIKGFPYCQDCIVSGVQLLRSYSQSSYIPLVKKQTSPFIAMLLSLVCPGLGAAYNGQMIKALVYFAVFVGLFQMALLSKGTAIFVLGFLGMWLYAALDSWRTAQMIRAGLTPDGAEDILVRRFSGNPKLWGGILTVLGASFFLKVFFNIHIFTRGVLPVLLIGLGVYLLRGYVFKRRRAGQRWNDYADGAPAFSSSLRSVNLRAGGGEFDSTGDFETETRVRTWKNG